ncbi:ribonuclease P [Candidatus Micrarchaeota archaeon]|nr:ribonuclease P [Candidatus Micrarchaeota archaeon]
MKPHKADVRQEAREQAAHLLEMARDMWPKDEKLARRYVHLARQLAMRHRVHLDPRAYCKACGVPFVAATLKVRLERRNQTVLYACQQCNALRRVPYLRKTNVPPKAGLNRQPGSTKSGARQAKTQNEKE